MSHSNLNPGNLSLMEKSMMIDGTFTIHLDTEDKNLAKHLIDTGHRAILRFVFLDPDIIAPALTYINAYGLEPKDVEKPGFWPMVRKLLSNDSTFASATNEETREWKYLVELYYAAWLKYAKDDPRSTKGFVASPVRTNVVVWDLHLAIADWSAVMGGDFRATVDKKGFEILEEREHKAAAAQYYAKLEGDKRFKDVTLANWGSGWDMCIQMMMSRSEDVLQEEREMMRRSAMDNIARDRQLREKDREITEKDREIDELKARFSKDENMVASEDAGATGLNDESLGFDKVVTSSVVDAAEEKIKNVDGLADENDAAIKTKSTADREFVAEKSPEMKDADKAADKEESNDSKSFRGKIEVIDLTDD